MSLKPEQVTLETKEIQDDGGGGEKEAWIPLPRTAKTVPCTVNFYKKVSFDRLEDGLHNSAGPGEETLTRRCFTFKRKDGPFPRLAINDRITRLDGTQYIVQMVRSYELTMQVDGEIVA